MAYEIELYPDAWEQVRALPAEVLPALSDVMATLAASPWNGPPLNELNPEGAVRVLTFGSGGAGLVAYLILEEQRRVDVLRVLWLG